MSIYNINSAYKIIDIALNKFFDEEAENIAFGVSERNLVGRLAFYIENLVKEYDTEEVYKTDPEYNKNHGGKIKTCINGNNKTIIITCDLIVHTRGKKVNEDNFIAIEMKKSDRPHDEKVKDRHRLMALTKSRKASDQWSGDGKTHPKHVCGYLLGVYIELNIKKSQVLIEFYEKGKCVRSI